MLVLGRKESERILIGDDIVITVISIRRGIVRIGIDAPKDVSVHREEIALRVREAGYGSKPKQFGEASCNVETR